MEFTIVEHGPVRVAITRRAIEHVVTTHAQVGLGSVFRRFTRELLVECIASIDTIERGRALYEVRSPDVGFDLVVPRHIAEGLPEARIESVCKPDRDEAFEVPRVFTSRPIESFVTDALTLVIRPVSPDRLVDLGSAGSDAALATCASEGSLFALVTAWPGRSDVPPVRDWHQRFCIVVPGDTPLPTADS